MQDHIHFVISNQKIHFEQLGKYNINDLRIVFGN